MYKCVLNCFTSKLSETRNMHSKSYNQHSFSITNRQPVLMITFNLLFALLLLDLEVGIISPSSLNTVRLLSFSVPPRGKQTSVFMLNQSR